MPQIPDLPGALVPRHSPQETWLKAHVARLCGFERERFPGAQPVSFGTRDLAKLETQDFWVCEKSDGIRVLLLVQTDMSSSDQLVYIIDRHNTYREVSGLFFPHHEDPRLPLRNTIVDGELVIDVNPQTKAQKLRFLAFDCLVVDDQNVMSRPLDKRYGRLTEWLYKPYAKMMRDHPHMAETQPFQIKVKEIRSSYHVDEVFAIDIPALEHDNDGLIYTCVNSPYTPGTDPNIMKWKPPSENSIDFKLILRFPPSQSNPAQPDYYAKPFFLLHAWCGDERGVAKYEQYDEMHVEDDEWEKIKQSGEQYDDRIVEVHWDSSISRWRMMRFRDDKPNGNHISVVENIIQSIADGVEKDALLSRSNAIRNAWKMRQGQPPGSAPVQMPPSARPPTSSAPASVHKGTSSTSEWRYGPLASSRWSKVSGPAMVAGFNR